MAERKWDLGSRRVELPDGSTFEFAWDMDVYPAERETVEEVGVPKDAFDGCVDDIVHLAGMLREWRGLECSRYETPIGILWEMHHRVDCLLHALTVTGEFHDTGEALADVAAENVARIRRQGYEVREFALRDGDGESPARAAAELLGSILGLGGC